MAIPPNMHMNDFDAMKRGEWTESTENKIKYRDAFPKDYKLTPEPRNKWTSLMRGVRVDGDTVVIVVKGGNEAARELCGALIDEMSK